VLEEDRIIARLSDPELMLWYSLFGTDRLSRRQIDRLGMLHREMANEAAPPRRMTAEEWAAFHAPPKTETPAKAAG